MHYMYFIFLLFSVMSLFSLVRFENSACTSLATLPGSNKAIKKKKEFISGT